MNSHVVVETSFDRSYVSYILRISAKEMCEARSPFFYKLKVWWGLSKLIWSKSA